MIKYDTIVSLGGNCSVAFQLRHRGLRICSFPLDWLWMTEERTLDYLIHAIDHRFDDFCLLEDFEEFASPKIEKGIKTWQYHNRRSGWRFIHHFHAPIENVAEFERVRKTFARRFDRLYESMAKARRALFVLAANIPCDRNRILRLHEALTLAFPSTRIDLRVMAFSSPVAANEHIESPNGDVTINRIFREGSTSYDHYSAPAEYAWLDGIRLSGVMPPEEVRRRSRWMRWRYKLFMALGKSLERSGAGCLAVRF